MLAAVRTTVMGRARAPIWHLRRSPSTAARVGDASGSRAASASTANGSRRPIFDRDTLRRGRDDRRSRRSSSSSTRRRSSTPATRAIVDAQGNLVITLRVSLRVRPHDTRSRHTGRRPERPPCMVASEMDLGAREDLVLAGHLRSDGPLQRHLRCAQRRARRPGRTRAAALRRGDAGNCQPRHRRSSGSPAASFEPGDVIIVNDPYLGGTHLMDVRLVKPFYYRGRLWAWLANSATGRTSAARCAGGFSSDTSEVHQEGLRLPPIRIAARASSTRTCWRSSCQLPCAAGARRRLQGADWRRCTWASDG